MKCNNVTTCSGNLDCVTNLAQASTQCFLERMAPSVLLVLQDSVVIICFSQTIFGSASQTNWHM